MAASLWWSRCSCHFIGCLHHPVPISIPLRIYKKLKNIDLHFPLPSRYFKQLVEWFLDLLAGMHRNDNTNRSSGYFFPVSYWMLYVHLCIGRWAGNLLAWGFCDFLSMVSFLRYKAFVHCRRTRMKFVTCFDSTVPGLVASGWCSHSSDLHYLQSISSSGNLIIDMRLTCNQVTIRGLNSRHSLDWM